MRKVSEIVNRKRIFTIVSLAILLILGGGTAVFLHAQEEYVPPEIPDGVDVQRSQVYLSGTGYTIDDNRDKTHRQEEKKKEEQKQEQQTETKKKQAEASSESSSARKVREERSAKKRKPPEKKESTDDRPGKKDRPGQEDRPEREDRSREKEDSSKPAKDAPRAEDPDRPTAPSGGGEESEEDLAKKPSIRISIASGQRLTGKRVDFTVKVTDYKGRNVPVFSEDDGSFVVEFNGAALTSSGTSGQGTHFRSDLADGNNRIRVSAIDREGNKSDRDVRFSGNTSAEAEVIGRVHVSVEAPIIDLGVIYSTDVDIHPGDTARDVLDEALFRAGITPVFNEDYLEGIEREGIAAAARVDDDTRALMVERYRDNNYLDKLDKNTLSEHDFYKTSGWKYSVNGVFPEVGLEGYKVEDNDEIDLIFHLADDVY